MTEKIRRGEFQNTFVDQATAPVTIFDVRTAVALPSKHGSKLVIEGNVLYVRGQIQRPADTIRALVTPDSGITRVQYGESLARLFHKRLQKELEERGIQFCPVPGQNKKGERMYAPRNYLEIRESYIKLQTGTDHPMRGRLDDLSLHTKYVELINAYLLEGIPMQEIAKRMNESYPKIRRRILGALTYLGIIQSSAKDVLFALGGITQEIQRAQAVHPQTQESLRKQYGFDGELPPSLLVLPSQWESWQFLKKISVKDPAFFRRLEEEFPRSMQMLYELYGLKGYTASKTSEMAQKYGYKTLEGVRIVVRTMIARIKDQVEKRREEQKKNVKL